MVSGVPPRTPNRRRTTVNKKVPVVSVAEAETANLAGLPLEASVVLADVAGAVREGLLGFCADVGLMVMAQMLDAEMTARVGSKHAKIVDRQANWHGTTSGPLVLGGRQVTVSRPRGRSVDGTEIELDSWKAFSSKDLLDRLTVERMLAGVATRRHVDVAEPISSEVEAAAKATGRSSVSRRFKRATEAALAELMARDLSGLEVAVIMIDGLEIAGQCVVVALAICADGTKIPVGLWLGDTENKTVVTGLLSDLVARGLCADGGLLAVLDGAKALAAGVKKVFGDQAQIQRCTLHKRRNVKGYLPKELGSKIDWRLSRAFADLDPAKGLDSARRIAAELKADHPDAAASLVEGLEEMFTVHRLGVSGRLATTLTNTNCIESMISVARTTMGNVKSWKDGSMKKRWVAAGMLEAERNFRRVRGCKEMPTLVAALRHPIETVTPANYDQAAA
jgi:transposase-like protein